MVPKSCHSNHDKSTKNVQDHRNPGLVFELDPRFEGERLKVLLSLGVLTTDHLP